MRKASGRIVGLHLSDSIQVSPVRFLPCPAGREVNSAEGAHGSVIQLTSAAPQVSLSSATYFIRGREGTSRESAVLAEQIVGPVPNLPPKKFHVSAVQDKQHCDRCHNVFECTSESVF